MSVVPIFNFSRDNGRQVFPLSLPPLSSQTLLYCFRANPPKITIYLQLTTCIICGHLINSFGAVLDILVFFPPLFRTMGNVKSSLLNSSPSFTILMCARIVRAEKVDRHRWADSHEVDCLSAAWWKWRKQEASLRRVA